MDCLSCGASGSRVVKSMDDGGIVSRMRECPCGTRWRTEEVAIEKSVRLLVATPDANGIRHHIPPPAARISPSLATNGRGGVGGGLPSGSDLDPVPDPISDLDLTRSDPARVGTPKRRHAPAVTPGFARFYAAYPRKVGKPTALRAWAALQLEAKVETVMAGLARWLPLFAAAGWEKTPHPGTWLNDERWEAEVPARLGPPRPPAGRSDANPDVLLEWAANKEATR